MILFTQQKWKYYEYIFIRTNVRNPLLQSKNYGVTWCYERSDWNKRTSERTKILFLDIIKPLHLRHPVLAKIVINVADFPIWLTVIFLLAKTDCCKRRYIISNKEMRKKKLKTKTIYFSIFLWSRNKFLSFLKLNWKNGIVIRFAMIFSGCKLKRETTVKGVKHYISQ